MRHKKRQHKTDFATYIILLANNCYDAETIEKVGKLPRPDKLCGWDVPENLQDLTMGELGDIMYCGDDIMPIVKAVCHADEPQKVMLEDATKVLGFLNFVKAEMERIGHLFEQTSIQPTPQESKAGIDSLKFGFFGTLDWYARRMGYKDQNEVNEVKWVRVWQCAKQDAEKAMFERRLSKVYQEEQRQRR